MEGLFLDVVLRDRSKKLFRVNLFHHESVRLICVAGPGFALMREVATGEIRVVFILAGTAFPESVPSYSVEEPKGPSLDGNDD